MQLLKAPSQSFDGKSHQFKDITVEPLATPPPVWVAGGRQYAHEASPEQARMDANVLRRRCRWDGWIARPTSPPGAIADDPEEIAGELKRQGTTRAGKGV